MKQIIAILGILMVSVWSLSAQSTDDCFPQKPNPPRLVNDFANVISSQTEQTLEHHLVNFNDTTSTQIAIVTVNSICGYDAGGFTFELGEKWGVGDAKFNNGIVVMIKPKVGREKGHAFIATGYGLEGVLPDAIAHRIVNNEMIPHFKNNDYDSGVIAAAQVIMEIAGGEYSAEAYNKKSKGNGDFPIFPFFFILFFVIIMFAGTFRRAKRYAHRNDISLWAALFLMGSMGSRHSGHYNNFTSGRGGFGGGGGGGGFGGFGGGSFGGGGAGGSW
ncbi:MAG: TPM domain-containing protein [Vicingaceae bacterium]